MESSLCTSTQDSSDADGSGSTGRNMRALSYICKRQYLGSGEIVSGVKKCPKCGGEMIEGEFMKNIPKLTALPRKGLGSYDRVIPAYCKDCGFIEIYKEMKQKKSRAANQCC